jgi:hypothetical protein
MSDAQMRRRLRWRAGTERPMMRGLAVISVIVLIGAGCGGTGGGGSTSTAASGTTRAATARDKAVKFTECMRKNGVGDFPDPNAAGEFPSFGISVTPAVWSSAVHACKALQPPGSLSAHMTPAQLSAAVKFARCVRAHGVKDFPDPVNGEPLIDTYKIPSSNKPGGMTILNAATHKCGGILKLAAGGQR